jgi:hypothetical protein
MKLNKFIRKFLRSDLLLLKEEPILIKKILNEDKETLLLLEAEKTDILNDIKDHLEEIKNKNNAVAIHNIKKYNYDKIEEYKRSVNNKERIELIIKECDDALTYINSLGSKEGLILILDGLYRAISNNAVSAVDKIRKNAGAETTYVSQLMVRMIKKTEEIVKETIGLPIENYPNLFAHAYVMSSFLNLLY